MNIHRHGEIVLKQIDILPENAKLVKTGKEHIVGHSETGHHHILKLATPTLQVYELDNEMYLHLGEQGELVHEKIRIDVHKTQVIKPGFYKVQVKRAFNYFSKLLERVRD